MELQIQCYVWGVWIYSEKFKRRKRIFGSTSERTWKRTWENFRKEEIIGNLIVCKD